MILKEVEIHNFKSILKDHVEINNEQTCFIGINESGKTNYLKAISLLNFFDTTLDKSQTSKLNNNHRETTPLISAVFALEPNDIKWLDANTLINFDFPDKNKLLLQIKRWGNGTNNLQIELSYDYNKPYNLLEEGKTSRLEFIDSFFQNCYPTILYFDREDLLVEPANLDDLESADNRFETLRRLFAIGGISDLSILRNSNVEEIHMVLEDINERLKSLFQNHYKQDNSIEFSLSQVQDKFNLLIKDNSRRVYLLSERSPGFQYYFAFLINKIYLNLLHKNKRVIYILDEPGNNLHPKGARNLLSTFSEFSKENQLVYSTHNPFLVLRNCPESLKYVTRDGKKGSRIIKKPWKNNYQIFRKDLGVLLNDSFLLGDVNLIVEGSVEKYVLHRLIHERGYQTLEWLNIYDAESANKVPQVVAFLSSEGIDLAGIILLDSDKEGKTTLGTKQVKKILSNKKWDIISINDIYTDQTERTIEDLFPPDIYAAAYNKYCQLYSEQLEIEAFESLDTTSITPPIIERVKQHFNGLKKADGSHKTFENAVSKLQIAIFALDIIEGLEVVNQKKACTYFDNLLSIIIKKYNNLTQ